MQIKKVRLEWYFYPIWLDRFAVIAQKLCIDLILDMNCRCLLRFRLGILPENAAKNGVITSIFIKRAFRELIQTQAKMQILSDQGLVSIGLNDCF